MLIRETSLELFLRITFEFENRDVQPLPWCAGHHFYFTLPWHPGLGRRDYVVKIPSKKQWRHAADGKLVPFAELKGLEAIGFDHPQLSDCIFTNLKSRLHIAEQSDDADVHRVMHQIIGDQRIEVALSEWSDLDPFRHYLTPEEKAALELPFALDDDPLGVPAAPTGQTTP